MPLFLIFLIKYGISYVCKVPGSSNRVFFRSKVTISLTTKNLFRLNNLPHNIILPGNFVSISYLWTYYIWYGLVRNLLMLAIHYEGKWDGEIDTFLGPVKWHRVVRRMPFGA